MFELIVGLALLPVAIVVGLYLIGAALGLIWFLGGPALILIGALLMANQLMAGGMVCLLIGLCWTFGVIAHAKAQ